VVRKEHSLSAPRHNEPNSVEVNRPAIRWTGEFELVEGHHESQSGRYFLAIRPHSIVLEGKETIVGDTSEATLWGGTYM
jgi:hypothetical protein